MSNPNVEVVLGYLKAIEQGGSQEALSQFLATDVEARIYPNRLNPKGETGNLKEMLAASERGRKVVSAQRYEVRRIVADGDQVALEIDWIGTLRVAMGTIPEGGTMRASFGAFFTLREGRIVSQHNYDCFEPF
jgi:ketosteroid isomerase-like protein